MTNSVSAPTASRQHSILHSSTPFWSVQWATCTDTANTLWKTSLSQTWQNVGDPLLSSCTDTVLHYFLQCKSVWSSDPQVKKGKKGKEELLLSQVCSPISTGDSFTANSLSIIAIYSSNHSIPSSPTNLLLILALIILTSLWVLLLLILIIVTTLCLLPPITGCRYDPC